MKSTYTLQASGNKAGDGYTNRFAMDTTALPAEQFLVSNNVWVQVAAYSIGDLLFADYDGNGRYDAGSDVPAPDCCHHQSVQGRRYAGGQYHHRSSRCAGSLSVPAPGIR
ncbi:MAG: hypothetical protein R3E89_06000 [Thiolinea sp.]